MNYNQITKENLNKNIYLLSGDEYLIKQTLNNITTLLNVGNINIFEFNDENFNLTNVLNCCNQFSFFNDKRIIIIKNLQKELSISEKNSLLKYLSQYNQNSLLFILDNNKIFDFIKDIEKIECKATETMVVDYIATQFKNYGKQINQQDAKVLADFCKNDLTKINIEVKKISDYLGHEKYVTQNIIKELTVPDIELKVFDLTTNLAKKDIEKSHKVLYDMLKSGEPPIKILGLISSHFRRVFFAKINKGTPIELANLLGCKEYAITKAKQESANFTAKQLKDIQNLLLETDYNIKSGQMTQENALYYLVFKITLI